MPSIERETSKSYWRSPEEFADTPEFRALVKRTHPQQSWESLSSATRRQFLKVMGASLALAGLAGCRWPEEEIVPFSRPSGITPGVPLQYATSMELGGISRGLLVTSYDGRPIKIEGNPSHPESRGAADALSQASVLELYDPSRSRYPVLRERKERRNAGWDEFDAFARAHFDDLRAKRGRGLRILSETSDSPSIQWISQRIQDAFPEARMLEYEAISRDNERRGSEIVFGQPYRTHLRLGRAKVIVCLDADPLAKHPAAIKHARDFSEGRRAENGWMNRLYVIESAYTTTGTMADHRYPVPSREIASITAQLAAEILGDRGHDSRTASGEMIAKLERFRHQPDAPGLVKKIAGDLIQHRGESLVIVGARQPAELHALAHTLNAALGNVGETIHYTAEPNRNRATHLEQITELVDEMSNGEVETLLILGGNPIYDAPVDLEFESQLEKVATTIHLSLFEDETSRACMWHLPRAHTLESWGSGRAYDGTITITQPLIEPLYGGRSSIELLSLVLDGSRRKGHEMLRDTLRWLTGIDGFDEFERFWRTALHDGVVDGSAHDTATPPLTLSDLDLSGWESTGEGLEIVFCQDSKVYDGRFANNSWLQELPDPLTKLTWDNAVIVAPSTAEQLGVKSDDEVTIGFQGREVTLPAYVMPGQAANSIAVILGYGRTAAGKVGDGVGSDVYRLRTSAAMEFGAGATVRRTGKKYRLACTQNHHAIDLVGLRGMQKRIGELIREADLETYENHPDFARHVVHHPPLVSLWKEHDFEGHAWGMSIDLNSCTGCGACVVACQSENNIPVVGREEVLNSREMHWIRIDRYFNGDFEAPQVVHQPVACVQCENAPCEQVCPVAATVHSEEGLNQMVYNRCIGTRYCSNNCPYKVRRFNWFNNQKDRTEIEKMVHNPEVTVRNRGVMEKCTYCVQRIESIKIQAKNERRSIKDGEIVPACAQTCPTQAIVFGDLSDPKSRVSKMHENLRSYGMLEEINTKPRTRYLARLRNPASSDAADGDHGHQG